MSSIKRMFESLFGDFRWKAPPWAAWVKARIAAGIASFIAYVRREPRTSAAIGAAAVLFLAGGYAVWRWYDARPKPDLITYSVTPPALTCYDCEPAVPPRPLVVTFSASAAQLKLADKDLDPATTLVRLSPTHPGKWHWDGDRTLSFQPAEDWPVGGHFSVQLSRHGLLAQQVRVEDYDFEFSTAAFAANIAGTEFHQDPVVAKNKKAVATVKFTHPVEPAVFEKRVTLTLFSKLTDTREEKIGAAPFTVVYDKLRLNAYVHSEELAVPDKAGRLAVEIAPGVRSARGGNETKDTLKASVAVPGLYSLAVDSLDLAVARDEQEEPSQVLTVAMNHSVVEQEMPAKLHAWLLPYKHPDPKRQADFERYGRNQPYRWDNSTVTRDILAAAPVLELKQIPGEREHYELHSFRHDAEPGRFLYVKIDRGLKSFGGYALGDSVERVMRVPEFPREVRIAQQGSLLALSGNKTLTVLTRDVPALRIEVGRLLPRQLQHLVSQTSGSFSKPQFMSWNFDAANLTERVETIVQLPALKPGTPHYEAIPLGSYLKNDAQERRGVFLMRVAGWDPVNKRPLSGIGESSWNNYRQEPTTDTRLIVITDLGLIAKSSVDRSRDVFVQSIHSGEPVAGVEVEIIGRNGMPVLSQTTGADGHVRFPDLSSFRREQQPVLYLARTGSDSTFLPFEQRDRGLDMSRFDVGGVENSSSGASLSAYLFSDRGLYRPGEEIRIGAIVRSQDWRKSLQGVPLRLDIQDPRGIRIRSEAFTPGAAGFGEIRHATSETSPTGNYTVSICIVRTEYRADLIGSLEVQVRDFLPDRLRMSANFSTQSLDGWVSPDGLTADVLLQNLFGTAAQNRRVTARMSLTPSFPSFRGFPDYRFFDPQVAKEGFNEQLADTTTDNEGRAKFDLNLQRFARATYRLHLTAEGFEADGGRGVSAEAAQLVSNMPYLVGYKADGDLEYISRNAKRSVDLIAIDPRAQKTAVDGLKLARLETRFVSTLIRQPNGTFRYESRRKDIPLDETPLAIPAQGMKLALASDAPGAFAYVVRDAAGQPLTRIEYRVAGEANLTRTMEKNAELQIALARKDYGPGDEIEMQIQAPYTGAGLITIERDRVYSWRWFKTRTTSSTQKIPVPDGLEGNAYVNVSFVRDPSSDEIYTSPLSYGVQPFSIDLDARRNAISVKTPALVKPGEELEVTYSTVKPARIVVFAIDEGILQVARYKTPDPLGFFFQKRALQVSTAQILDLILPELRAQMMNAAPGGDADGALGKHLNPFKRKGDKPVVYWSGIVDADKTPRHLKFTVPDYFNGTLRVMAVAVNDTSVGVHESKTTVRGDFVLSPNAPTTVTPGDEFDLSVGVANNLAGSGPDTKVAVTLKTDPALKVIGAASQTVAIAEGRETAVHFRVQTLDKPGAAALEFSAGTGRNSVKRKIDLSVRPATPYMTWLTAGTLRNTTRDVQVTRQLYPEYRTLQAGVSLLPLGMAHGLVTYLNNYPYSCTEQLVSMAVPALVLSDRPEFGYVAKEKGATLQTLISELRLRQNDVGAYRLWPGGNEIAEFVAIYTQHFLLEASERGINVPGDLMNNGNQYLRTLAARDGNNLIEERNSAYALYLLTRQGQLLPAETAKLRKRLTERYKDEWRKDLAAAWLASALQLMQQKNDAQGMIGGVKFGAATNDTVEWQTYYDGMTSDAFLLYLLSHHFPERLAKLPPEVMQTLADRITRGAYQSLSSGSTVLALDAYAKTVHAETAPKLSIAEVLKKQDSSGKAVRALPLPAELFPKVNFTADAGALRFGSGTEFNAYYLIDESGFDRTPPKEAISKGFEILRDYTDLDGKALTQVAMGQQVDVHLKFRGLKDKPIPGVALVDLLPGGFELVVPPQEINQQMHQASASGQEEIDNSAGSGYSGWSCQICIGRPAQTLRYADMREDRVVFYVDVRRELQEIVYRIKATNQGSFVVPPAYGEAMYDRSAIARSAAGKVVVKAP